jgi:uncharacterized protein (DUF1501 family)
MLRRRDLFGLSAAGLLLPRRALAGPAPTGSRKFLYIYAYGGWDPTMLFAPMFTNPYVDMESDATTATVNGVTFVDSGRRPQVRSFFENYGDRTCMINGIEVRSVTHERCQRILFTGSSESGKDDWPSIAAGRSTDALLLPHLVVAGPAFTNDYSSRVVRIGDNGQLPTLLDGSALGMSTRAVRAPSATADTRADAYLRDRLAAFQAGAKPGRQATFAERYSDAMADIDALRGIASTLNLDPVAGGCQRDIASDAATAFDCFELGISRCALTRDDGWCSVGWDTHVANHYQSDHYDYLFQYLNALMEDLDGRTGLNGTPLRDEVTIVVFSEMGRHPQINSGGGRDHWTFTSALLIGSGIRGGQTIGGYDDNYLGRPIDLATGEADDGGDSLVPGHLGATLLALADIDPGEWVTQAAPIAAAMEST